MTEPEASDVDLAEQAAAVTDDDVDDDFSVSVEADTTDLIEQHRGAPLPDDDYDR